MGLKILRTAAGTVDIQACTLVAMSNKSGLSRGAGARLTLAIYPKSLLTCSSLIIIIVKQAKKTRSIGFTDYIVGSISI